MSNGSYFKRVSWLNIGKKRPIEKNLKTKISRKEIVSCRNRSTKKQSPFQ